MILEVTDERHRFLRDLLLSLDHVPGCVVECGVKKGSSLALLAAFAGDREVYGFDSWEPDTLHGVHDVRAYGGSPYAVSMRLIEEKLARYGLPMSRVVLTRGWIADTLPRFRENVAFANVDVDIYQSYVDALTNLWPRMSHGGVMILDEYHEKEVWPGASKAVDEFLAGRNDAVLNEGFRWWIQKL